MIKLFMKQKLKILYAAIFFVSMMLCFGSSKVYAANSTNINANAYIPEDPSIYNTTWSKAKVKYWTQYMSFWYIPGFNKTRSYIRITDEDGNFINNLTRLEACWKIGGKEYHVNKIRSDKGVFTTGEMSSKEGLLCSYSDAENTIPAFYSHEKASKVFVDNPSTLEDESYKECNYVWTWNYKVEELVYLYVWYFDDSGKEVASSFLKDGAHPVYDSSGVLQGIYNSDNELMENYTLNSNGIPSLNNNGILTPIVSYKDQQNGVKYDELGFMDFLNDINGDGQETFIDKILALLSTLTTVIVVVAVVYGVGKICSLGTAYFKSKR